jgi:iron complex outermembrane receptor protein
VYAQDLLTIGKIDLLAGLRYNYDKTVSDVYTYAEQEHKITTILVHPFTPRFGIVYHPAKDISLFGSYSNSFTLNRGVDTNGKALPPSFISQYEAGLKSDWFNRALTFNVTAYMIVNSNLAQTSLANGNTNSNIKELEGEVTSKGVEIDILAKPLYGLNVMAGYSYNNSRYTKSNTYKKGTPLQHVPSHTVNGSVYYTFNTNTLKGFNIGLIAFYLSGMNAGKQPRITVADDTRRLIALPSFTRVDATVGYNYQKISIRAKLSNVFNALGYYAHEDESVNPIAPRIFWATVSFKL